MTVKLSDMLVTNAAGMVKTEAEARALLNSAVTRITVGSITLEPRQGNLGENYYYSPKRRTAWNSRGLPNPGIEATIAWLGEFRKECNDAGKELAVSIAGFSPEECGELAGRVMPHVDATEFNGGCGNVWKDNKQKPIPSYFPELMGESLACIGREIDKVDVKYSPVTDVTVVREGVRVMVGSKIVRRVTAVNTFPNQRDLRDEEHGEGEALAWRESEDADLKHLGGLSGAELLDVADETVTALLSMLPRTIPVIGCGGIFSGEDAMRSLDRGARGFAIGTAFFEHGPRIFSDVLEQASELVGEM